MKKIICMLLALMLMGCAAFAQEVAPEQASASAVPVEFITIGFEDGFCLSLPSDWLHYPITEDMANDSVLYCLSSADASRWLYIQSWETDCTNVQDLHALISEIAQPENSGIYSFNQTDFVVYDLVDSDVSCCSVLLNGGALNFVFTPQSDSDFMLIAAQIISSFALI